MSNKRIKTDINFLEYPCHIVNYKSKERRLLKIETKRGIYTLASAVNNRLPSSKDRVILYYFIKELAKNDFENRKIITNRYKVSKEIWNAVSGRYYKMIIDALTRYSNLTATFENVFYMGKKYKKRIFHFIESFDFLENGELLVVFNENFVNQLKNTNYYRLVNYNEIKKLRSNVSIRLYEYLLKQSFPFKIGLVKFGKKLTLSDNKLYESTILPILNRTIKEVNLKTSLSVKFEYNKKNKVFTFFEFF